MNWGNQKNNNAGIFHRADRPATNPAAFGQGTGQITGQLKGNLRFPLDISYHGCPRI